MKKDCFQRWSDLTNAIIPAVNEKPYAVYVAIVDDDESIGTETFKALFMAIVMIRNLCFDPQFFTILRFDPSFLVAAEFGNQLADEIAFFFGGDVAAFF